MSAPADVKPWWLGLFLAVWLLTMSYVATFFATVLRIRRLTGEAQSEDDWIVVWRDPLTVRYLGWIFSGRHKALGDHLTSRLVYIVRVLFILDVPAMLAVFALIPLGAMRSA